MDPDQTLENIRELYKTILRGEYTDADSYQLAEAAESLDQWLSKKGFLPEDWKTMTNEELRRHILNAARDAARSFAYYDRKEDEECSVDDLKNACDKGVVTTKELGDAFAEELRKWGGLYP